MEIHSKIPKEVSLVQTEINDDSTGNKKWTKNLIELLEKINKAVPTYFGGDANGKRATCKVVSRQSDSVRRLYGEYYG
jgi:hypothetical protein